MLFVFSIFEKRKLETFVDFKLGSERADEGVNIKIAFWMFSLSILLLLRDCNFRFICDNI